MKLANKMIQGHFLKRYKRFMVDILCDDGSLVTVHCANTGSMRGCLHEGAIAWCSDSENPTRKYRYTLESFVLQDGTCIYVNPVRANALVREALEAGLVPGLRGYAEILPEVKYGEENSRIDFLLRGCTEDVRDCYVEVKNVTLYEPEMCGPGGGCFPDAVSTRGQKHLRELQAMVEAGQRAVLFFVVSHSAIRNVQPADHIDPEYGRLLREAVASGVEVMAWRCDIQDHSVALSEAVPFSVGE